MFQPNFVTFTNTDVVSTAPMEGFEGNQNGGFTYATFADGSGGLIKQMKDWHGNKTGRLYRAEILAAQEYLAALVGKTMNAPVRDCRFYGADAKTVIMPYINGQSGEKANEECLPLNHQGITLKLFDYLTANADRRPKNWMRTPDGRIVGIDHALCNFRPRNPSPELVAEFWNNGVSHEALLILRPKLQNLHLDFAQLGMADKHETMMQNLSHLIDAFQMLSKFAMVVKSVVQSDRIVVKGDVPGHDFHGNQYVAGIPNQHGPAWDATTDKALIEGIGKALGATGLGDCFQTPEAGLEKFDSKAITDGKLWASKGAVFAPDKVKGDCHGVSLKMALGNPERYQLIRGYGLSKDGMWRSHTFIQDTEKNRIIEPTPIKREAYFGAPLSPDEVKALAPEYLTKEAIEAATNSTVQKGDVPGHDFHGNQWTTTGTSDFFGKTFHHADYTTKDGTVLHATAMPHVDGGTFAQVEGEKNGFVISNTNTDFGGGQGYYQVTASDANGNTVGHLDYVIADGEKTPYIQMVETDPSAKGEGLATAMYHVLAANNPGATPDPGMLTDDGAKWWNSSQMQQARAEANTYVEYKPITKGDLPRHEFHGNQWTDNNGHVLISPHFPYGKEGSDAGAKISPSQVADILKTPEANEVLNQLMGGGAAGNTPLFGGCLLTAQALKTLFPNGELKASMLTSPFHLDNAAEQGKVPLVDHFVLLIGKDRYLDARGEITEPHAANLTESMYGEEPAPIHDDVYMNHLVDATPAVVASASQYMASPPGAAEKFAAWMMEQSGGGITKNDEPRRGFIARATSRLSNASDSLFSMARPQSAKIWKWSGNLNEANDLTQSPTAVAKHAINLMTTSEILKGDVPGHDFHGNQWTGGEGDEIPSSQRGRAKFLAEALHDRAVKNEPEITREINETCQQFGGVRVKPEFAIKGADSTTRKLLDDAHDYLDTKVGQVDDAATNVGDALRYTIKFGEKDFASSVQNALDDFKTEGFEAVKVKNFFNDDPTNAYRGINCVFRDSTSNQLFEVQFHTPASSDMVAQVHPIYEATRVLDPSSPEYAAGQAKMVAMWQTVPIPAGIGSVGKLSVKG